MTDIQKIATDYIDLWNERASDRRREMLKQNWTDDATYIDPLMSGDGRDGVDALIAGVQQRFPEFDSGCSAKPTATATICGSDGDSAPTALTARSRARISPCSATEKSAASPDSSIRCRKGREASRDCEIEMACRCDGASSQLDERWNR